MTAFFTVCNRHQLPGAIALGESVLTHHTNTRFVIGFADDSALPDLPLGMEIVPIRQLAIPQLNEMSNRYFDFEFVHAARPWFARHLFKQEKALATWVFLAPTVLVYSSIDTLTNTGRELLLTPHITQPLPPSGNPDDKRILNIGMFHSNAWIARSTENTRKMADWWSERTTDRAFFDLCNGMCLDQLWLNYAPIHVPDWAAIRSPLWHLGLHNAQHRPFEVRHSTPVIDDIPVLTTDFAGLNGFHPVWSDHLQLAESFPQWRVLLTDYRKRISAHAAFNIGGQPRYGRITPVSVLRKFRKTVKSELDQIVRLIDKIEI